MKIVWRSEPDCETCAKGYAPFVSEWGDLFSQPELRHAANFPGAALAVFAVRMHGSPYFCTPFAGISTLNFPVGSCK